MALPHTVSDIPAAPARRLVEELDELHARYAAAVNLALESGDEASARELAEAYDDDAVRLIAEREGRTHLLPLVRRKAPDTPLRRLVTRLKRADSYTLWAFNPPAALDPRQRRAG